MQSSLPQAQLATHDPAPHLTPNARDPENWSNVAVRNAKLYRRPLIYLYGLDKGVYEPIFPVYIVEDDPASLTFRLQADVSDRVVAFSDLSLEVNAPRREYQTVAVKRRVHQHRFRELVLKAYTRRCAICELGHASLLDAAHIMEDRDERGLPEISNGLTLCKIHHSAYDVNIRGNSPDLTVHVREDILREIDGPMLEHGLEAMAGRALRVPRRESWRPNREFLDDRFARFRGRSVRRRVHRHRGGARPCPRTSLAWMRCFAGLTANESEFAQWTTRIIHHRHQVAQERLLPPRPPRQTDPIAALSLHYMYNPLFTSIMIEETRASFV